MRYVPVLLALACVSVTFSAAAETPAAPTDADAAPAPSGPSALPPKTATGLENVHGGLTVQGGRAAGRGRDVDVNATAPTAAKPVRLPPTPRALRKMNADRAIIAADPSVRACASESASSAPISLGLRVSVGPTGEVEGVEPATVTSAPLPQPLVQCVAKAIAAVRFGAPGPAGAAIVVPVTIPARPAGVPLATAPASTPTPPVAAPPAVTPVASSATPTADGSTSTASR